MKKSSDNTNRPRKLEEVFRDGFEPAEVSPRASIWHHIEQELEVKQAGFYKKRLVWYRSVAAASITLLLVAFSYFWYDAQTGHQLKLPGTSAGQIVQNKSSQPTNPKITNTAVPDSSKQATIAKNLKKEQIYAQPPPQSQSSTPRTYFVSRSRKNKVSQAVNTNAAPLALHQRQSSDKPLYPGNKSQTIADKLAESNFLTEEKEGSRDNNVALQPAQPVITSSVPVDSLPVITTQKQPEFKKDSAAVIAAALLPEETKKKAVGSRWALGGGTGSQYFEQNVKFAGAGSNQRSNDPSYNALTANSSNTGSNTIEAASKEFNENTRSAFSYRAAVAANYRINNKWSIEAGLNFAENKAQTATSYIIYKRPAALQAIANIKSENAFLDSKSNGNTTNVTIPVTIFLAKLTDPDLTNTQAAVEQVAPFNMYYRYRQLALPMRLRYQHGRGKWFNFVQAGGALNVLVQTSIISDSPKVPSVEYPLGQSSPFRKWYVTALGSVGRGLKISEVWQVQGSLDVARSFSTITLNPEQIPDLGQQKPYYVGFGISSSYVIGEK